MRLNPPLSRSVQVFALVVLIVLLGGMLLRVAPELIIGRWPWHLGQYSARFLGAIYAAEFVALGFLLVRNRWAPGRLVLAMALTFTLVATLVSLVHLEQFNFGRRGPWVWFALYGGSAIVSAALLWRHRRLRHPGDPPGPIWRRVFLVQAIALCGYGALLLVSPRVATGLWPWPALGFTARVYAGMFLAAGLGAFILSRRAAFEDFLLFGLTQVMLGGAALASVYMAKALTVASEDSEWETPPDFSAWIIGCGIVALMGLTALEAARREHKRRSIARLGPSPSTA
jgi:hypothetical protein